MDRFGVSTETDTITMTQLTFTQTAEAATPLVTVEMVKGALAHLNREQLRDVWQFVQFLDYKASVTEDEVKEDDGRSWVAVQAHETYKMRDDEAEFLYRRPNQAQKPTHKDLPREEVIRRLMASGFVRPPEEYDSPAAQEWRELTEEERQQHLNEMDELYFPDSPASTHIIENG